MGFTVGLQETGWGIASCTYPSRACPTYCGYCTALWWLSKRGAMFGGGHTTRRHVASPRYRPSARRHHVRTTYTCLWHSGRRWWNTRPCLQKCGRPSNASQRSQRPNQEGAGLRQCAVIAGTKFVVLWRWQAPRWLDRVAVGQRTLPRVGCHVPRYVSIASHLNRAVLSSGIVANDAGSRKSIKYS